MIAAYTFMLTDIYRLFNFLLALNRVTNLYGIVALSARLLGNSGDHSSPGIIRAGSARSHP